MRSDRNWVEFMSVLDSVFADPTTEKVAETRSFLRDLAEQDGIKERAAPRALLELEARARQKQLGSGFGAGLSYFFSWSSFLSPQFLFRVGGRSFGPCEVVL